MWANFTILLFRVPSVIGSGDGYGCSICGILFSYACGFLVFRVIYYISVYTFHSSAYLFFNHIADLIYVYFIFSAEDQLVGLPDGGTTALSTAGCNAGVSFLALRQVAADHMRANADHFRHFIGEEDAAAAETDENEETDGDAAFNTYCNEVATTAAWGGQIEIEALSRALKTHIKVFSVGLPVLEMGEEYKGDDKPTLQLCYLRHAYGLGEHYNSVMPRTKRVTFEGESSDEDDE